MRSLTKGPMLACSDFLDYDALKKLQWPKIGSIKKDGFRCLSLARSATVQPISRYMKPIPNYYIQDEFENFPALYDGELIIPGGNFQDCQSRFTTRISLPFEYTYYVFDHLGYLDKPYLQRLQILETHVENFARSSPIKVMPWRWLGDADEAWVWFQMQLENGEEGIILRDPDAKYKSGRSTLREEGMLKLKGWEDREAIIIDFVEAYENTNTKERDERGYAKRSSKKAGRVPKGTLGAIVVKDCKSREIFNIGSGWTAEEALAIWRNRHRLKGSIGTYKFQPHGTKEKPRQPIWKGLRPESQ